MSAPIGTSNSRFRLEAHDHNGLLTANLPYRNMQGEFMLGSAGAQWRCEIPHRGYAQVTRANLWEGKHELWLYDKLVDVNNPIFQGPVWDITPSSDSGVLSVSAQDSLSYLAKRRLGITKNYSAKPEAAMQDLYNYLNSGDFVSSMTSCVIQSNGTKNVPSGTGWSIKDRPYIADAFSSLAAMGDGVDYFVRGAVLNLYGGLIKPTAKPFALEYGGSLDGYSVQYNAQTIANTYETVNSVGRVGSATNAAKKTEYNQTYQTVEQGSELPSTQALIDWSTTALKDTQSSKTIPSIITRTKIPIKDFDFGDQFIIVINDWYVQVNMIIRIVGWQLTVGQGDKTTSVIYTKDTEGVT